MRRFSIALLVLAVLLLVPVLLYDPMDEETALFRQGAPTEKVLEAREIGAPSNPYAWLWKPALGLAIIGGAGLLLSRKKS